MQPASSSLKNIGSKGIVQRYFFGFICALAASALFSYLRQNAFPKITLLFLFPLWMGAMLGLLQARRGVCIYYAAKGVCRLSHKEEPVAEEENKYFSVISRRILLASVLAAALLTFLCFSFF